MAMEQAGLAPEPGPVQVSVAFVPEAEETVEIEAVDFQLPAAMAPGPLALLQRFALQPLPAAGLGVRQPCEPLLPQPFSWLPLPQLFERPLLRQPFARLLQRLCERPLRLIVLPFPAAAELAVPAGQAVRHFGRPAVIEPRLPGPFCERPRQPEVPAVFGLLSAALFLFRPGLFFQQPQLVRRLAEPL